MHYKYVFIFLAGPVSGLYRQHELGWVSPSSFPEWLIS